MSASDVIEGVIIIIIIIIIVIIIIIASFTISDCLPAFSSAMNSHKLMKSCLHTPNPN